MQINCKSIANQLQINCNSIECNNSEDNRLLGCDAIPTTTSIDLLNGFTEELFVFDAVVADESSQGVVPEFLTNIESNRREGFKCILQVRSVVFATPYSGHNIDSYRCIRLLLSTIWYSIPFG